MAINYRNYKTRLLSIFKSFFSNDTLVDSLKSDNNLKKIITKEFTIANTIQDNIKTKTNPFDEFSNKFKKITGSKTISDKANITDNYQIEDDINHLITFVKNMYKIDLEDSKNVVREELVTSEIKEPSNSSFNKTIPAGLISKDISPEMFLQGNAMNTISKKMKTGEIYLFTSKPPLIKILKYISIGILSLLSISSFLIFISCIIVGTVSIDGDSFSAT
ncbi:hypothetical protein FACS189459_4710 [Bacilli bacterium]|nr:hypothetical protein FACS189459_4710 [Bacilli bacterium]